MANTWRKRTISAATVSAATMLFAAAAQAHVVSLSDTYYGGLNTYNNSDIVGDPSVFDTTSVDVQRIGAGGDTLQITINTNYAGMPGTPGADGTGYGALFLTPGYNSWHPTGPAPYVSDVYHPGEWSYAVVLPQTPTASAGTTGLYAIGDGTLVMANVNGVPFTAPNAGNNGFYFRQAQAVQFTPFQSSGPTDLADWSVGAGKIVIDIADNHLLGDNFSLSWAMTCANDVIQGQISDIPEPSTWSVMICGAGLLGFTLRRRRASASGLAA